MDKEHCLIVISTPCYNLIGLAVGVKDDVKDERYLGILKNEYNQLYINNMVAMFGFLDKEDYDSSYYNIESSFASNEYTKMFGYGGDKDIVTYVWNDIQNAINQITAKITHHRNQNVNNIYLIYMPTVEEMRLVKGFKSAKRKRLWFCSDWSEDTN